MARKPKIQVRVDRDIKDGIDAYIDDQEDVSEPEAIRHVLRAGLASKGYPIVEADGGNRYENTLLKTVGSYTTVLTALVLMFAGLSAWTYAFSVTGTAQLVSVLVGVMFQLVATGLITAAAVAQLAMSRPLRGLVGLEAGVRT
jgi:hypothetical protein